MTDNDRHSVALRGLTRDEAVGYWDGVLRSPDAQPEDLAAFRAWCEDDASHLVSFEDAQALLAALPRIANRPEIKSMREAALSIDVRSKGNRSPTENLLVACMLMVLVGSICFYSLHALSHRIGDAVVDKRADVNTQQSIETALGERSLMSLPDGTQITLNTETELSISYSASERAVILHQGEAHFDVAKESDRRFVVYAAGSRVTAVGTAFDVRYTDQLFKVTLFEGFVEVGSMATEPAPEIGAPGPATQLIPGQQMLVALDGPTSAQISSVDVERATLWRQGRVFFEDTPLAEAIQEMNRYSALQIVVVDEKLAAERITGTFRTGGQEVFLGALETYFDVEVVRDDLDHAVIKMPQSGP